MLTYKQRAIKKLKKMQRETNEYIRVLSSTDHPDNVGMSIERQVEMLKAEKVMKEVWPVIIDTLSKIKE